MPKVVGARNSEVGRKGAPQMSMESREAYLTNLAMNVAEQQMLNGTASSQVITHFLKAGAAKTQLELEQKRKENLLIEAKIEALKSNKRSEELFERALKAMRSYTGAGDPDDEY